MMHFRLQIVTAALWLAAGLIASFVTYVMPTVDGEFDLAPVVVGLVALACYLSGVAHAIMAIGKVAAREFPG